MNKGRGRGGNPWNNSNHSQIKKPNSQPTKESAEQRFQRERDKLQASVKKLEHVDSSSEEEDVESSNVMDTVLQRYSQMGGGDLGRTREFLDNSFQSGAGVCLICIASVKRVDPVWSCVECYGCFHIVCIQKWSRDSLFQQKQAMEDLPVYIRSNKLVWGCPKCRRDYETSDIPSRYWCYCGKAEDPEHHPWLIPHSCGETCDKPLRPDCGHRCLLLCHPGPCPPCPKTVKIHCYCGKNGPQAKRCSEKLWSCHQACGKKLTCNKHTCVSNCHPGQCPPCPQQSDQSCDCGLNRVKRPCSEPRWKCDKVCGKPFSCGHHVCTLVCHSGPCGDCPLSLIRSCPCGKTQATVACTQEVPTCNDTCGKLMECGVHHCQLKCHKDKCACLEIVRKVCRCGLHTKELPCGKEYTCDTKCKRTKACKKHPCNRKCCDGMCPSCEKPCGRTLPCGTHKCPSVCHRGVCYPCPQTAAVRCRCGSTSIIVPCGRERRTRAPRCKELCKISPDCHHPSRKPHNCHFGECPPCKQVCEKHNSCVHSCSAPCHTSVWLKVEEAKRPAGPWEVLEPTYRRCELPCPPCAVPVPVTCLGGHETSQQPCSQSARYSCGRVCGWSLQCGNHTCSAGCHLDKADCIQCELPCQRQPSEGCSHSCTRPCHPDPCASPCSIDVKVKCHCGINMLFIACHLLTEAQKDVTKLDNLSCGNHCPNTYPCGHNCRSNCHAGDCPDPASCRRKMKVSCPCGRLKKEFGCDVVRRGEGSVLCDKECISKKEESQKAKELEKAKKAEEAERKNRQELEKFEKKFQAKKKTRDRRRVVVDDGPSFFAKYWAAIAAASVGVAIAVYFVFY